MATIDDFGKIELTIGEIVAAEPVEGSEKLLRLDVDFAEDICRQVVSGIAKHVDAPSDLIGKRFVFVTNLEPRSIMGFESQAMILAGGEGDTFTFISPTHDAPAGTKLH